jgi:2-dehydro-3-deoxyphosphogluconate aldolase/(4S)-4-hydroxy-2-oxoglutarate aldolase
VPEAIVGAGTVRDAKDLDAAVSAGSSFAVSPGATPALLDAANGSPIPMLPGAATVSEAMALNDRGFKVLKLFPAEPVGGVGWLKNVSGPLPRIHFCPTGGINAEKAPDYLALDNVVCVGGSWVAPTAMIRNEAWREIEKLARAAFLLGKKG